MTMLSVSVNDRGTQHLAARVIEQDGNADELNRGTPSLYQQVPDTHWPIHMRIPVSPLAAQLVPPDHSGQGLKHTKGLQSASDNSQHKGPESHNSVMSKTRLGVVSRAWGALCRTGASLMDGWGLGPGNVVEGLCEVCGNKGGYLYLLCNNGIQTSKVTTIRHHFEGNEEAAREIKMQSCSGADIVHYGHCRTLCLFPCWCVASLAFGLPLHEVFLPLTVSGTFPYAERKWGVIRNAPPHLETDGVWAEVLSPATKQKFNWLPISCILPSITFVNLQQPPDSCPYVSWDTEARKHHKYRLMIDGRRLS